ncbi:MAG: TraR/DksA C4-type zinc finger protein [Actinobacteria bacterium]|nr:TraR/DksA C4-type zinc finger protein [Actinomycetota bacterium]MBU1865921.1 TraR/DksA C4-type zinc finger protein [Actinomycetota bacterium]
MSTHIHDEAKRRLDAERTHLVQQLTKLGATADGELRSDVDYGDGFADAAAATAERTETIGLADSIHRMLMDVDAALARLEQGTYGVCAKCGKEIPEARLEFRPESIFCVSCKSVA